MTDAAGPRRALGHRQYHSTLPRFASQHTAVAFHPGSLAVVIACASNHFYIYNVEDARLSDWARYGRTGGS